MKNVVIVGFGFMGTMHAQAYQQIPNARLVAVVDAEREKAGANLARLGLQLPVYSSLKAALAKAEVDVVDVCLPTDAHRKAVLQAIQAGRQIFCEKPLALKVKHAEQMAEAAEKAGVRMMVGQCIRFWPEYQAFVDLVRSNRAGKLLSLTLQRRSGRPMQSVGNWLNDPARSAGAALDLHIHDTDFVLHLLGKPAAVSSQATRDFSGFSHIFTQYLYDGMVVSAEGGWNYPGKWGFQMAFQAVFENGTVEYDSGGKPTLVATIGEGPKEPLAFQQPGAGESTAGTGNLSSLGGYFNELNYFIGRLESGQPIEIATARQAVESVRTVLAEMKSAEKGRPVKLG